MALIQTTSISIRQIDNYKSSKNKFINGKNCLLVNCPYDAEIIEEIKGLNWQQREWDGKNWAILKHEEDQQSGQETNHEFVRRITKECAQRRGWLLADYTCKSAREIEKSLQQNAAELHENHVNAVLAVLPKLPGYSLRLIRWGKTLKLQLTQYLGDEYHLLFKELYDACAKVWKPQALASFDPKMQSGFVFELASDARVIRALMQCKGVEYFKVHALQSVQIFDDGVSHLVNLCGERFIGLPVAKVDMSEIDFDNQVWQVALVNDEVYWVDNFSYYITSWLEEKNYSVFYRTCIPKQSNVGNIITFFHLEEWFKEWALQVLATDELQEGYFGDLKAKTSPAFWQHPADKLISHISRFSNRGGDAIVNLIGLTPKEFSDRVVFIRTLKEAKAQEHLTKLKAEARTIVANKLTHKLTKDQLRALATNKQVSFKKSWTKDEIATAIVTQEYAEKELGIEAVACAEVPSAQHLQQEVRSRVS